MVATGGDALDATVDRGQQDHVVKGIETRCSHEPREEPRTENAVVDGVVPRCEDGSVGAFDHRRTGLDHFAFKVADEGELDRWIAHLDDLGVAHSPVRVRVLDLGRFVSFDDPDGIPFELWL